MLLPLQLLNLLDSADTTAPVLSSPTATADGLTINGTVDTDEGNGTLYYYASENSSETAATIKTGDSQSVTSTGTQNVTISVSAGDYYLHFVQDDSSSNESNVVSSSQVEVISEVIRPTGGFWFDYDRERARRDRERKRRLEEEEKAQHIKNELDRALAIAQRELEAEDARKQELARLTEIVKYNIDNLPVSEKVVGYAREAIKKQTYSVMERLERELKKAKEEEDFILKAAEILLNQ